MRVEIVNYEPLMAGIEKYKEALQGLKAPWGDNGYLN